MRVLSRTLVALAALLLIPSMASALGISIVSVNGGAGSSGVLRSGETITFDLRLQNDTGISLIGVESEITGYDLPETIQQPAGTRQYGLELQSGAAADAAFGTFGLLGYSGIPNSLTDPLESQSGFGAWRTRLFAGGVLPPASFDGTGQDDPGIDGALISDGDVHFRVTFVANPTRIEPSSFTMSFDVEGLLADNSGIVIGTSDTFDLTVVPEPGTALLMGLGLAALGARRRA